MSNNFIEVFYDDGDGVTAWKATKSQHRWKNEHSGLPGLTNFWVIAGTNFRFYSQHDVAAMRLLLDAIELRFEGDA